MKSVNWGAVVGVCCWIIGLGMAHAEEIVIARPVPADGGPTSIHVAVALLDIDEVDSAAQNFAANIFFAIRWNDPRLAHSDDGERMVDMQKIWHPAFLIVNEQRAWSSLPRIARVSTNGDVLHVQRVWGMFSQPLQLHDFPFDTQDFQIRIASTLYTPDQVAVSVASDMPSGLAPEFSLPDWEVQEWALDFSPFRAFGEADDSASFSLNLVANRYASHYVLKVILPLILIVAMSWIVFWIDPKEVGVQIGVATTSMLTLIAYRFMVGSEIPVVPYLTRIDLFILGSTILVYASLIQAVTTSMFARQDKILRARWLDQWCRIIFPLVFIGMAVWSLFS